MRFTRAAFTLIELLVVVTIIVVLISLLAPAMDTAIYQAEITVCGTQLKGIANGTTAYAFDNKRYYPDRPAVRDPEISNYQPSQMTWPAPDRNYDDRRILRNIVPLKIFNCPLSGKFNVDTQDPNSFVYSNYLLWFGYGYTQVNSNLPVAIPTNPSATSTRTAQGGLFKLGNQWSGYNGDRFSWLVGDQDLITYAFGNLSSWGAHPDKNGQNYNSIMQDEPSVAFALSKNAQGKYATSVWLGSRGHVDLNFAHTDNSVRRFNDVPPPGSRYESMMAHTGQYNTSSAADAASTWNSVPKR